MCIYKRPLTNFAFIHWNSALTVGIIIIMNQDLKKRLIKTIKLDCANKEEMNAKINAFNCIWGECEIIAGVIARVALELWSGKLYTWAENVIRRHARGKGYFDEHQLADIHAFDDNQTEFVFSPEVLTTNFFSPYNDELFITPDDIIYIIWEVFNMEKHYNQTRHHRYLVKQIYKRLKIHLKSDEVDQEDDFYNSMDEIIERHDLSKYAFSQAIGYTLKWVHDYTNFGIWKAARNLHIINELHHPESWRDLTVDDVHLARDMSLPYLYESLIDMIARDLENKKGQDLNISDSELISMDGKYLKRYNANERQIIEAFIVRVKKVEQSVI